MSITAGSNILASDVQAIPPVGSILMYGGTTAPTGWLLCNGSPFSRTTYGTLFGIIGTAYGVGDGSTTFNVPDMQGRIAMGAGAGKGVTGTAVNTGTPTGTALTVRTRGQWGGEETHTLLTAEIPSHTHSYKIADQGGGGSPANSTGGPLGSVSSTGSAGSDGAHANLQPYMVVNFIIRSLDYS